MRISYRLFLLIFGFFTGFSTERIHSQQLDLIPLPAEIRTDPRSPNGHLQTSDGLFFKEDIPAEAMKAMTYLRAYGSFISTRQTDQRLPVLSFLKNNQLLPGQYRLHCSAAGIKLFASSAEGFFYACQTLVQLQQLYPNGKIPFAEITDRPTFSWRGLHLDVCRHYFPVEEVKRILRVMSLYKLNVFHWHLTDDQGWRIEIPGYQNLKQIASRRKETLIGHASANPPQRDGIPHEGFYTGDQIRSVVAFADSLGITIVPEIEMPGHAQAAIAAYPWLGVKGENPGVWTDWGVSPWILSPKDSVFTFLEDVLGTVMDLFPFKYIHIGGDEATKDHWKSSPAVQRKIRELGLKDEHELQSWFIRRIEKFVNARGRQIIGWDEILEGGLAPNAGVMSWRGEAGGIEAAGMKHPVVMSPGKPLYFDHYQSDKPGEPLAIGGLNTLENVYNYHPLPAGLSEETQKYILGAQANLWTEYIATASHLEYMAFPRALALAEACWLGKDKKNYVSFLSRLDAHRNILKGLGVNFREWK